MSGNIELQKLFEELEHMLDTRSLTRERLAKFWEDVSSLAEEEEDVDKDLLETMKGLVNEMTAELDIVEPCEEAHEVAGTQKLSRAPRDTRGNTHVSISKPDDGQASKLKPMLILWTGFFVGTAVSYRFNKKPLSPVTKTVLTTFAAKAADIGFDKAYQEFQSLLPHH
jgi:hypothetical protein